MALSKLDRERLDELLTGLYDGRLDDAESAAPWLARRSRSPGLVRQPRHAGRLFEHGVFRPRGNCPAAACRARVRGPAPAEKGGPDGRPTSPVLGFLGNLTDLGGSFTPTLWTLLVLVSGMVLTLALVIVLAVRGVRVEVNQPDLAQAERRKAARRPMERMRFSSLRLQIPNRKSQTPPLSCSPLPAPCPPPLPPAPLVRAKDCRWNGELPSPEVRYGPARRPNAIPGLGCGRVPV